MHPRMKMQFGPAPPSATLARQQRLVHLWEQLRREQAAQKQREAAQKKREEAAQKKREEAAQKKREEAAQKRREQAAQKRREQAAQKRREQAAQKRREQAAQKQREQAAQKQREQAAQKQREQAAQKQREQAAQKQRVQAAQKQREQAAQKQRGLAPRQQAPRPQNAVQRTVGGAGKPAIHVYGAEWCGFTRKQNGEIQEALAGTSNAADKHVYFDCAGADKQMPICKEMRAFPLTVVHEKGKEFTLEELTKIKQAGYRPGNVVLGELNAAEGK